MHAQITTDGTLGAAKTLQGPNYSITADLGRQAGGNLFHSFGQFSVPTNGSATFSGPSSVSNIISRVTGGEISSVDGVLRSTITGANLFLINPRGILFGPHASLDLTGSFTASTASYVKLADGTRFEATATVNPILTSAPPAAFGFLGPTGPITVQGSQLQVAEGKSINLVGGSVGVSDASIKTVAGDIRLIGVAGAGEVMLAGEVTAGTALAPISLQRSALSTESANGFAPGRILIRGGQLTVSESSITSTNNEQVDAPVVELAASGDLTVSASEIKSQTGWSGRGADTSLSGESVTIEHNSQVGTISWGDGRGGDIDITARNAARVAAALDDPNFTNVYSWAFGPGAGGDLRARGDTVTVDLGNLYSYAGGAGKGGSITLRGREVGVTNAAYLYTYNGASGGSGDIDMAATDRLSVSGTDWYGAASVFTWALGSGNAGNIRASAPELTVRGGEVFSKTSAAGNAGSMTFAGDTIRFLGGNGGIAYIDTTAAEGSSGNGGNIDVRAATSFEVSRADYPWDWTRLSTSSFSVGRAGDITVEAPSITVRDTASIWAGAFSSGRGGDIRLRGQDISVVAAGNVESVAAGAARGGDIDIAASRRFYTSEEIPVPVDGFMFRGVLSHTFGEGDAGNIRIGAPEITLLGGAVHSITYGAGNAGTLRFDGDVVRFLGGNNNILFVESGASTATTGNGGNVEIRARTRFELNGTGFNDWSRVAATTQGTGQGGQILVESPNILIEDASFYSGTRFSTGNAGDVTLRGDQVTIRTGGELYAGTAGWGRGGSLRVEATGRLVMDTPESGQSSTWWPAANGAARIYAYTDGPGAAGDVTINAPEIYGNFGARIVSYTTSDGNAGTITVNAQRVKLTGYSSIDSSSEGRGNAGNIVLNVGESFEMSERTPGAPYGPHGHRIEFNEQSAIWRGGIASRALGPGNAGSVYLNAPNILLDDARILTSTFDAGRGGHTEIRADNLTLRNGAQIDAKSIAGSTGDAGSIVVNVANRFEIAGMSPVDGAFSGVNAETLGDGRGGDVRIAAGSLGVDRGFIRSSTSSRGDAGFVDIRAHDVLLSNGGWIDSGAATGSTGAGGSVSISATGSIAVSGSDRTPNVVVAAPPEEAVRFSGLTLGRAQGLFPSTISSNTAGVGPGGNVTLSAPSIRIEDGGRVSATSIGTGNAGSIGITAADALRLFGGTISSEALHADGGNIDIRVGNLVHLRNSEITTAVGAGAGAGGNIFIDPTFVILENSRITANAFGGPGGNIKIFATYFLNTLDSLIDASSSAGLPGTVSISSPNTNLSTQIKVLPAAFFDATQLVREACSGRGVAGGGGSSLVGVGRGGLAASPERFATSTYFGDAPAATAAAPSGTALKLATATRARLNAGCNG